MTENAQTNPAKPGCSGGCAHFNYCFWAKLIVAIPALPLAAYVVSTGFSTPIAQMVAGSMTMALLIVGAVKLDQMPMFQKKIVKRD